jgi:glycosyltransferase involved in cell wall biosynthesis
MWFHADMSRDRTFATSSPLTAGVSVVVPVYRSTVTLPELVQRIDAVLAPHGDYEIILVDDGSPRETWRVVSDLAERFPTVHGLRLGRNFGQHNALVAGVRSARYDTTVTLDDDLQNPPEEMGVLLAALVDQDVVYGVNDRQAQDRWRRFAGRLVRLSLRSALGVDSAPQISSYRAFRTQLREAFTGDVGPNVSLDALLSWGGSRFGSVQVAHKPRSEGTSNYSFTKLVRFALDTATGYSTLPLQVATLVGLATSLFGVAVLGYVIIRPLVSGGSVAGFPFLASTIAIFSGVQLFALGVIGEYLARMHFRIAKKPTYVVLETAGASELDDSPDSTLRPGSA